MGAGSSALTNGIANSSVEPFQPQLSTNLKNPDSQFFLEPRKRRGQPLKRQPGRADPRGGCAINHCPVIIILSKKHSRMGGTNLCEPTRTGSQVPPQSGTRLLCTLQLQLRRVYIRLQNKKGVVGGSEKQVCSCCGLRAMPVTTLAVKARWK